MNKQDWTYKKLGEVATIYDSQRKPVTKKDRVNGIYPYYGATGIQDYVDSYLFDGRYLLLGEDGAKWGANDKSAFIIEGKSWVNNHAHIMRFDDRIIDSFVEYYLNGKDLTEYITGAVVPKLTQAKLTQIPIPVPPIEEQERIVAELDLLSGIIEKKKEQLKAYDQLAQSIFYTMFGDPIDNPKGWETKKLRDVCHHITDGDHMPPPKSDNGIPFLTISNVNKDKQELDFSNTFFVPQEYYDNLKDERKARINDMLYTVTGSYGIPVIVRTSRPFCFQRHIALLKPIQEKVLTSFLFYWALCPSIKEEANSVATGIAQKTVGLNSLRQFNVILPPLSLQQEFAEKVEAIERQKALVQQSIVETQTMFDFTMDKYFG